MADLDAGPDVPFDRTRFRTQLEALVSGRGTVHWRDWPTGRSSALLLPASAAQGEPVYVTMVADEAVITTGLDAKVFLGSAEKGDEDHVIEVIAAIIDGGATEYASFGDELQPFTTSLIIIGPWGSYSFDTHGAVLIRHLPAWPDPTS